MQAPDSFLHSGWVLVSSVEIANDVLGAAAGKRAVYDAVAWLGSYVIVYHGEKEGEQEVYTVRHQVDSQVL